MSWPPSHRVDGPLCRKEVDGIAYEVECQSIVVKDGDVDIGA
jgi:hypothetical protein